MNHRVKQLLLSVPLLALGGCELNGTEPPYYQAAATLPDFRQPSFSEYVKETTDWLQVERYVVGADKAYEISVNAPREFRPHTPNGDGILLVHGLGDSPYSFVDIARHLSQQGYLVRTMLLPGHGSKVGDLQLASDTQWQESVAHQVSLLRQEVDNIWLGGYSTGANLVTSHALAHDEISGLILYSPAFKAQSKLLPLSEYAQYLVTWADRDPEHNRLRYESLPMKAAVSYYQTTKRVRSLLSAKPIYNKPVFMVISEGDNVIDKAYASDVFQQQFTHPNARLVWLGETPPDDPRAKAFSMKLPALRISEGSHMGALFAPDNREYGIAGRNRICSNGQPPVAEQACEAGADVWYSSYGYTEEGKIHARLTYNPYFAESMQLLAQVLRTMPSPPSGSSDGDPNKRSASTTRL
ncbi:alpha/beta hydrolase [Aeromonas fluvialis]|uniref:alpha/beta hydrolase n=1 Tax=Aeromonas fluvialis TaxID=591962 RepID=UPI000A002509|nr:alpha/beta fold hydrolase [Aeromonas fluvialis]